MLFIAVLCSIYRPQEWKKVLILVTAFTIGHSCTLVLVGLHVFQVNSSIVEMLIPVTILLTAIYNIIFERTENNSVAVQIHYIVALLFGLVHGMGFSSYFSMLLGVEDSILLPLFAFNVGIELGQIVIVLAVFSLSALIYSTFKKPRAAWVSVVSIAAAIVSTTMIISNWQF